MAKKEQDNLSLEWHLQATLLPEIERPYILPNNWIWTKLKTVCALSNGNKVNGRDLPYLEAKFLRSKIGARAKNSGIFLGKGTKVILVDGENSGEVFRVDIDGYMGSTFKILDISRCVNDDYVEYFINMYKDDFKKSKIGSAIPHLNKDMFYNIPFPLPPLDEQYRIVDYINILLYKLDEAKEKIQTILDSFEIRKAAILDKAFTGELTRNWRKETDLTMESWEYAELDCFLKNIESGKSFRCIERPPQENEIGIIKVSAVTWGEYDENESKTCLQDVKLNTKNLIHEGDFLFSRANTIQLLGACVIVKTVSKTLMLSDKILRFQFKETLLPQYALYSLRSRNSRRQIIELASGNQESMRNIGQTNIRKIIVSVPTIDEQIEIVRILDNIFEKEKTAKELISVIEQIDLMKKAIFACAFRGKLGTNDHSEENAIELLKSIILESIDSEQTKVKRRTENKNTPQILEVCFVAKTLLEALSESKILTPEKLKAETGLEINDFYDQLKELVDDGRVIERREGGESYLEVSYEG